MCHVIENLNSFFEHTYMYTMLMIHQYYSSAIV